MSEIAGTIPAKQTAVGSIGTVYGKDGLSAYQIALKNGFVGTEKDWLESLRGPDGYTPILGIDYWTPEDVSQMYKYINSVIAQSDIVCEAIGSTITLTDSSNRELQGLTLSGTDAETVTVKVTGKNIADLRKISAKDLPTASTAATTQNSFGTTLSATTGNSVTVTQSKWPTTSTPSSFNNGYVVFGFYCPVREGDVVTVSFDYEITNDPLNMEADRTKFNLKLKNGYYSTVAAQNNKISLTQYINSSTVSAADGWNYLEFRNCGTSGVISNFQIEYGKTATDYEPYKEQTLVVTDLDNIDYAQLHTYKPVTNITNDAGAEMSVEYVADTKNFVLNEIQKAVAESVATLTALTGV